MSASTVAARLGITPGRRRAASLRRLAGWVIAIGAVVAIGLAIRARLRTPPPHYATQAVGRGDLAVTISATGKLEPTHQVEVGSEQSGIVASVAVDNNDRVVAGQELARIDPTKLEAQTRQAQAALDVAKAQLRQADATLDEERAKLDRLERVHAESNGRVPSVQELESQRAATARADGERARAKASVEQASATLAASKTDLSKLVIRSPIHGVVLSRAIDPGQTVAAAFQAPVLFTIAESLAHMELELDVDEADIGAVAVGQDATFTVDAYPERSFRGTVAEVRFAPETVNGVVTYKTVLRVDNTDLALRPGMTANADLVVQRVTGVVTVPSAALRVEIPGKAAAAPAAGSNQVWVLRQGTPVAVPVVTGATDGASTEIRSGELAAGDPVVVDVTTGGPR